MSDFCPSICALRVAVKVVTDLGALCKMTIDREGHVNYPCETTGHDNKSPCLPIDTVKVNLKWAAPVEVNYANTSKVVVEVKVEGTRPLTPSGNEECSVKTVVEENTSSDGTETANSCYDCEMECCYCHVCTSIDKKVCEGAIHLEVREKTADCNVPGTTTAVIGDVDVPAMGAHSCHLEAIKTVE